MNSIRVKGASGVRGVITVPGDKSISHRSIILGSVAEGITRVRGFLESEDCLHTADAFRLMGVQIDHVSEGEFLVYGRGLNGLREPSSVIDTGNSGTGIRLITGILAGQPFYSVITGDESIRTRPMGRIANPLRDMGAHIYGRNEGERAPLTILGGHLQPIHFHSPVASAQVKSAVLFAGMFTEGETSVSEPALSRNHSELMLRGFGAEVRVSGTTSTITGRPTLEAQDMVVPADISSAAFFIVAGLIVPNSEITIKNVGVNPTRTGILDALIAMNADIAIENIRSEAGEPVADITARTSQLKGTNIDGDLIPRLIDEIPILAVAAALAEGNTVISDAEELRVKETDRIATVASEISKFGVHIDEKRDGMIIHGGADLAGAVCESHGDHRIAMSCAIAGLASSGETIINGTGSIATSFPGFEDLLKSVVA